MSNNTEAWGTRVGLVLAMAGNAVGLGNFLRFPIQAVQNGGGAFIIPYLVCFIIMGIPLLWIEWSIGRYGGKSGNHSTPFILGNMTRRSFWKYFGVFGIFTNVAVAAYYCYIESWTMSYVIHSVAQTFSGMSQAEVSNFFGKYVDFTESTTGLPYEAVIFYLLCLGLNTYILSRGLQGGVEKAAKIGMPLLILFGVFLAFRGITLGDSGASADCVDCNSLNGLNFLWEPQFGSLLDPKVWLAAAGQIFFTLSVGMGTIHCYAAYVRSKDDIALNAMSAGWMNGFVEIVLGGAIVIPIAVGFLGLDWVKENAGFAMAFQTMPFLFGKWGVLLGTLAGMMWFGLLFFAGITSSLAMGTPWMGFMEDEFKWKRNKAAISFGILVLIVGLPTVFFFEKGVFDEYDYWAGTVSLVVFALAECIIFAWIFGIDKGWAELNEGADLRAHNFFKPIIKYVTPILLLFVFIGALFTPKGNDWKRAFSEGWELDASSIIGKITNKGIVANRTYFADYYESETDGLVHKIKTDPDNKKQTIEIANLFTYYRDTVTNKVKKIPENMERTAEMQVFDSMTVVKSYTFGSDHQITVKEGDKVQTGDKITNGARINDIFYIDMARLLLVALFVFLGILVFIASQKRKQEGRNNI